MHTVRLLLSLISIFVIFISASGEKLEAQGVGIGVTGGINASAHLNNFRFVVDDNILNHTPYFKTGFNGGLIIRKGFTPGVRFQAEPSVILLGANYEENFRLRGVDFHTESKTDLIYAHLPLVIHFSTLPPDRRVYGQEWPATTFHLSGGVFSGYLIEAGFTGTNSGAPDGIEFQGEFANDVTDQYSKFDAGLLIGAGFEHGLDSKVGLETRLLLSAISSGNAPEIDFSPHNVAITLALYFIF